ncbi:MAG: hypothetical protein AB1756_03905 [Acidobacteriota bacterium]
MVDELIIKRVIEKFIESKNFSSKMERQVSNGLLSLLQESPALKQKLYDARIADTKTKRDLVSEILEEVRNPILSSIFQGVESGSFYAELPAEAHGDLSSKKETKGERHRYRKVIRCTFEK